MSTDRQATCEERIGAHLTSRIQHFADLSTVMDAGYEDAAAVREAAGRIDLDAEDRTDDELRDDAQDAAFELPLSVERKTLLRVDLSTGGPADWFEFILDEENDPERVSYHFADWFDHAERTLDGAEREAAIGFAQSLALFERGE